MSTSIWWIRRDLRLSDNPALTAALASGESMIPVFILDPQLLASPYTGEKRLAFLFAGLRELDASLRQLGSALVLRLGDPVEQLNILRAETNANSIVAEQDFSPYARRRDQRVGHELPLTLTTGVTVHSPDILRKADGTPYTIFTPFSRMWRSLPFGARPLPAPQHLPALPSLASLDILARPSLSANIPFLAGEAEAQRRLAAFADGAISRYAADRDRMDLDGTSGLSPYLRLGMLSSRQAAWSARQAEQQASAAGAQRGAETWLNELIWREFYIAILYHFPFVRRTSFRARIRRSLRGEAFTWREDPAGFALWAEGCTGYPIVDAAMRQLNATGWMHNRARMIVASFLTKDLLIDWRLGERYFMQHLIDGDPAANNAGWQWAAGTGADAAPYFRVFNPLLQSMKFDPHGVTIRRWVPELEAVPAAFLHAPWTLPADVQARTGCIIGKTYPAPMVDHAAARQRALAAYQQIQTQPTAIDVY